MNDYPPTGGQPAAPPPGYPPAPAPAAVPTAIPQAAPAAGYQQPVAYQQPAYAQQPVYQMAPVQQPVAPPPPIAAQPEESTKEDAEEERRHREEEEPLPSLILVSHSTLFYWWPVWVVGYIMAFLTWTEGQSFVFDNRILKVHPSPNLGVLFFLTLFLVIVVSNVVVRGLASAIVILGTMFIGVLFAHFGWWEPILNWFGNLNIYLNQGAYFWFSTLLFLVWAFTVFVFDRMSYYRITPGQLTHEFIFGNSSQSYDTENMALEKRRNDLFRHWLLGLGSGDLRIHTFGGRQEEIQIPNVLFIGAKITGIQRMIAEKPDEFGHVVLK